MTNAPYDLLILGATVFDGSGGAPVAADVGIRDGRIADIRPGLSDAPAQRVVEAAGKWLMPGLLDIHTHFDLEVEIAPHLPEAVRHGTTTVVTSNCSLGLAFGNQRRDGQDPVVDCFARVENIPKPILAAVAEKADWTDSAAYLAHLDSLPLGPNLVPLVPHSMLRIEVMGLKDSIERDPSDAEIDEMARLLDKAMGEGYAGFSTDALPFHYLANRPNERRRIPAQYGRFAELKRLTGVVRDWDRLWQATPHKDSPKETLRTFLLSSGRFRTRPLRLTAVAALDVATNRSIVKLARRLSRLLNSRLVDGRFRLQALAAPFKVWAEGPLTPLAEEIPELRLLNEPDLEDRAARRAILTDPAYIARFQRMWVKGKRGWSMARLKRLRQREEYAIDRSLDAMVIDRCPVPDWHGETVAAVYARFRRFADAPDAARSGVECAAFERLADATDEATFLLALWREFDTDFYWYMVSANRDPAVLRDLLMDPLLLPGFNDSGAHLTNMAFYDGNLRALRIAQAEGAAAVATMVRRLTSEPADFFGIDAGRLAPGAVADLALIDPVALADYDSEVHTRLIHRDDFGHHQLVNRSDGVVALTVIGGRVIWDGEGCVPEAGHMRFGRCLRAANHKADAMAQAAE